MLKIVKFVVYLFEFIFGNILSVFMYERKYLTGRHFKFGKAGWRWIIIDAKTRIFLGQNKHIKFPVSMSIRINNYKNLIFNNNDMQIFQGVGKYFQAEDAQIEIGSGCHIANNVGIITTNHDVNNLDQHVKGENVTIGKKCWIGMNSIVLPGVILGDQTIVGAGSVVTKSFPDGHCVICGNPAKVIKYINKEVSGDNEQ